MCEDPADAAPSSWRRCAGVGSRSPAHQVHLHPELEDRKGAWRKRRWAKKHARKTGPKVDGPLVSTSGPSVFPEPVGAPPRDRRSHALTNGLRAGARTLGALSLWTRRGEGRPCARLVAGRSVRRPHRAGLQRLRGRGRASRGREVRSAPPVTRCRAVLEIPTRERRRWPATAWRAICQPRYA